MFASFYFSLTMKQTTNEAPGTNLLKLGGAQRTETTGALPPGQGWLYWVRMGSCPGVVS